MGTLQSTGFVAISLAPPLQQLSVVWGWDPPVYGRCRGGRGWPITIAVHNLYLFVYSTRNWVCLLLYCEMCKYLCRHKGGEETDRDIWPSWQHFRRKIIRKFVVPAASLNTYANSHVKMHNRQFKVEVNARIGRLHSSFPLGA